MEKILIVEDEPGIALELKNHVASFGYNVIGIADRGTTAIEKVKQLDPNLILMDINLNGDLDGIQTTHEILKSKKIPIIFISAFSDKSTLDRIKDTNAYSLIIKPFSDKELHSAIELALYKFKMEQIIAEREQALRESELKFKTITESILDIIFIIDKTGKQIYFNERLKHTLGYDPKEIIGGRFTKHIPLEELPKFFHQVKYVIAEDAISSFTTKIYHKNGSVVDVEINGRLINFKGEQVIQGTIRDITDRKKAEANLKESEQRFKSLYENSSLGLYRTTPDGKIILANPTLIKLLGFDSLEDLQSRNLEDSCCYSDSNDRNSFKKVLLENGEITDYEATWIRKDGIPVNVIEGAKAVKDTSGNIIFYDGTIMDITEKRKVKELLKHSEQLYKTLVDTLPDAVTVADINGNITFVSNNVLKMYGESSAQEILGRNIIEWVAPEEKDKALRNFEQFIKTGILSENHYKLIRKDGSTFLGEINITITTVYNNTYQIILITRDITEKKITEENLIRSEAQFRTLVENINQGYYTANQHSIFTYCNPSISLVSGFKNEELLNRSAFRLVYQEDRKRIIDLYKQWASSDINDVVIQFRTQTKDGTILYLEQITNIVRDENGKVIEYKCFLSDITKRKTFEDSLLKLSRAIEQSPVSVVITDVNGIIEYVNKKFIETSQYSLNELIGGNINLLKSGLMPKSLYAQLWAAISAGKEWSGELQNRKKNGELYWELALISPIKNKEDIITNYIGIKEDITEKKKLLADLIEAKQKAEEMNKVKSYFFANMSHELRTPFVGIMGFSELLSESLQDPEEKNMAQQILKSSKRLTDTLNKILNVTRLEFDSLDIKPVNFDICKLINDIVILYSNSAQIKNTTIRSISSLTSLIVNTDPKVLEDVLNNLVSNAVKFTENGEITISINEATEDGKKYIILKVADTGIGIPEKMQKIVWQEFRQASEGFSRSFEGTGLGLTISKRYVEILGGVISLHSQEGKGTTFTIKIPFDYNEAGINSNEVLITESIGEIKEQIPKKRHKPRILVVEDEAISLQYLNITLKTIAEVDTALKATDAILLAESNKYDILMLDINLGRGMDGIELLHTIQKLNGYKNVPAIAMTAYAAESDKAEFLSKGFTGYISKPFSSQELKDLILKMHHSK